MNCNFGIKKDGVFKQCKLNINHVGGHDFKDVIVNHASLKSAALTIMTQCGLWGGLIAGILAGGIPWKMGNGMAGIGLGILVFLTILIGVVELASRIEKKWGLDIFLESDVHA